MAGFQSRVRDVINQAAPTHATVAVSDRGLTHFLDPSMTGVVRFMQKSGYPYSLLTPQISALLAQTAAAGTNTVVIRGSRLLTWLIPGVRIALELLEDAAVASVTSLSDGEVRVTLTSEISSSHATGTRVSIRAFPVSSPLGAVVGDGAVGSPAVVINSPFLLVPGDVLTIGGATFRLSSATQTGVTATGFTYDVKLGDTTGFPELSSSTEIMVAAKPAYQSEVLTTPQEVARSLTTGPVAIDWVSGPMVSDYFPNPESECYLEEFNAAGTLTVAPRLISKNDTLLRFQIGRDQMLFWSIAEGSVDWDGTFMQLKAHDSGRAHLWTPCRPLLDAAPPVTTSAVIPGFAPYRVLLLNRIVPGSIQVTHSITKAVISSTSYTSDDAAGTIDFTLANASQPITVTYRPRLEWQLSATADVNDVEVVVKIGSESKIVFSLPTAGVPVTLTIPTTSIEEIDQIHVTIRRADDSGGPMTVQFGDWQPRGDVTSAIRYTLTTAANIDYDWASSGLLLKALWPTIELLRARLDGESNFSRYLDNGRILA